MIEKVNLALLQPMVTADWNENMERARSMLDRARTLGAEIAILPEMFICPYELDAFAEFAEPIPDGRTSVLLSSWAKEMQMVIIGGSIPELDSDGRIYNTATAWDSGGGLLASYRKIHMFDVDLPGGVSFYESQVLSPGNKITVFDVCGMRCGLAICFDIRFPEVFRIMALEGAEVVFLPGAFNHASGPVHWEMSLRARAVENTIYMAGVSGISPPGSKYQSWGHSMLVDPFGEILVNAGSAEGIDIGVLDPERLADIRSRLPLLNQRREDVYITAKR